MCSLNLAVYLLLQKLLTYISVLEIKLLNGIIDPTNSTMEKILKELLQSILSLQQIIAEIKDTTQEKNEEGRHHHHKTEVLQWWTKCINRKVINHDGKEDHSQEDSGDEDSDSDPTKQADTEDHKSSDINDIFTELEEGKPFLKTIFFSKLEYLG